MFMAFFSLTPVSWTCTAPPAATSMNPPMNYDVTLGSPAVQALAPPFPNLPAHIDEINGAGPIYTWNQKTNAWVQV